MANLVQSLTITMHRIREVSTKMANVRKEIGVEGVRGRQTSWPSKRRSVFSFYK